MSTVISGFEFADSKCGHRGIPKEERFLEIVINVLASAILLAFGYIGGQYCERRLHQGKNLEEYDFYPFALDESKIPQFDSEKFCEATRYFLRHRDYVAARQLILIGQQNDVENNLKGEDKSGYQRVYNVFGGDKVLDDTAVYLENYKRIVRLIGESFPDAGIEILLHDLANPAKALLQIKNNITGRDVEAPATNLVLDLKMRGLQHQDKLNYELRIGARRFKCTTIPIYRESYGLVGAICINVDVNYLKDEVLASRNNMVAFIDTLCKTGIVLDENTLSKDEYTKAISGKRHFRDFAPAGA